MVSLTSLCYTEVMLYFNGGGDPRGRLPMSVRRILQRQKFAVDLVSRFRREHQWQQQNLQTCLQVCRFILCSLCPSPAAEFLFKPYLQDSTFFPRCCDTSWWSALMTNTFMLRLNGCSLEVRRGFTALPGLGCLPWAQAVGFPLMSLQQTFCSCYFSVLLSHCHLAVSAKIVAHIRNCKYRWQERIPALDNSV